MGVVGAAAEDDHHYLYCQHHNDHNDDNDNCAGDYGNGYGDSDDVYHYDVRDCVDILGQTCRPWRIVKVKVVLPLKP